MKVLKDTSDQDNSELTLSIAALHSVCISLYPFCSSSHAQVVLNSWQTCKNIRHEINKWLHWYEIWTLAYLKQLWLNACFVFFPIRTDTLSADEQTSTFLPVNTFPATPSSKYSIYDPSITLNADKVSYKLLIIVEHLEAKRKQQSVNIDFNSWSDHKYDWILQQIEQPKPKEQE